jgi:ribosomal protein S18 acetylase RimI-like enzyme
MLRMRSLREVRSRDLSVLLQEEAEHWAAELEWDYSDVIAAISAGLDGRTVEGAVHVDGARAVAYCYWLREDERAVVGSAFASEGFRGQGLEEDLVDAVIAEAQSVAGSVRVEGQTLFSTGERTDERFAQAGFAGCQRHYLVRSLAPSAAPPPHTWRLRPLCRGDLASAAGLVYRSHVGTVDARLNSTYASPARALRFVESLVLRDACGRFEAPASFVVDGVGGPDGVILCSRLSAGNGHICQVSVAPHVQRRGLGSALMLTSLGALRAAGFRTASLSVTVENAPACRLYDRLGFRPRRTYGAHAWVRGSRPGM